MPPSGVLSLPLAHLETLLAASPTFQAWVGATDATEAKESIHLVNIPQTEISRPFALIDLGDKWFSQLQGNGFNVFTKGGDLRLLLEADVNPAADDKEAAFTFLNEVGNIISDMEKLSGTDGFLSIHEISFDDPPGRSIDDEEPIEGVFYRVVLLITWGI